MQIEMNNDQTLFCYMTEGDFKDLNILPEKLAYGSNDFRRLISFIMKKAYEKYRFSTEDLPSMVEAVPLANGELFIQITLIEEAEELDPRFAQFAPCVFYDSDFADDIDIDETDIGNEHMMPPISRNRRTSKETAPGTVYTFTTYEALTKAIKSGSNPESFNTTKSSLYYNPENKNYYLIIKRGQVNVDLRVLFASLCEYANARMLTPTLNAWIGEHCRCVIRKNAISNLLEQINV